MDEYNPMNYDCQPVEEPKQENGYDPYRYADYNQKPEKPKKDRKFLKITALLLVVALLGSVGGAFLTKAIDKINDPAEVPVPEESVLEETPEEKPEITPEETPFKVEEYHLPETLGSYDTGKSLTPAQVYELTVNSVVGIRTESTVNVFGQEAVAASAGSGFILSEDGYVITNAHVVDDAQTIKVSLFNGEIYDAVLVGADSSFDIAVLKMDAEGLQPVSVGNSDELKVGEEVAAIGNPLGELTFTMTNGILSALDREINTDGNPRNMLQTNAAINSGNSGGPLFDMDGNVIGVTSVKFSGSSSSGAFIEGLGFAIPINTALKVAYDLTEYGYVKGQAYLGIKVKTLDGQTASYYGLPTGPRVEVVFEGYCAEKAGMQVGDIVLQFNGKKVTTHPELLAELKKTQAGDTVAVTVYRAGAELELSVTLDEKPKQEETASTQQNQQPQSGLQPVDPEENTQPSQRDDSPYFYYEFPFSFGN